MTPMIDPAALVVRIVLLEADNVRLTAEHEHISRINAIHRGTVQYLAKELNEARTEVRRLREVGRA